MAEKRLVLVLFLKVSRSTTEIGISKFKVLQKLLEGVIFTVISPSVYVQT